jgi:hypothetical protein
MESRAENIYPGGVFFLYAENGNETPEAVNRVKARIQRNAAGLNLQRVHIFVIVRAHMETEHFIPPGAAVLSRVREGFGGDFSVPDITLCVLLYESLEAYGDDETDYTLRKNRTGAFLSALPGFSALADRTFLLSDRNEHGTVNPAHWRQIYEILARLPLVRETDSRLYRLLESKAAAEGSPLYLSAGVKMADTPPSPLPVIPAHIIADGMLSVAACPLPIFKLRGLTLAEAEAALFGDRVARFFAQNYLPKEKDTAYESITENTRVTAWRTVTVIRRIAEGYAARYQYFLQRQALGENEARRSEARRETQSPAPPPCFISLLRWDGLPEETYRFTQSGLCELRVAGGFSLKDLFLTGILLQTHPEGAIANEHRFIESAERQRQRETVL